MLLLNGSPLLIGGSPIIATSPVSGVAPSNLALSPSAPSVANGTASGSTIGTVSASGTAPITYSVSGGPFEMVGNSLRSTATLTGLATHNLTITATNAHGSVQITPTVTVQAGAPAPAGTAAFTDDVLMVGHSLVANALPASLNYIHNEINVPGNIAHCWAPGRGIQANWDNSSTFFSPAVDGRAHLALGGTEALVMTPVLPLSTNVEFGTEHEAATLWGDLAYTNNNNVRIYLYETWPDRRTGTGSAPSEYDDWHLQDWRPRISNQLSEWEAFSTYYENNKTSGAPEMLIIPCGQGMAKLYDAIAAGEVPGITDIDDFFDDEIHPNWLGFYFVEMIIWSTVYQRSPVGLPRYTEENTVELTPTPSLALATKLQQIAWDTVTGYAKSGVDIEEHRSKLMLNSSTGMADFDYEITPVDIMKMSRGWEGGTFTLDSDGWPTTITSGEARGGILTDMDPNATSLNGTYHVFFDGGGTIEFRGRASNVQTVGTGHMTFDYTTGSGGIPVAITATNASPNHLRNVRVIHEDFVDYHNAGGRVHPHWARRFGANVGCYRFMDMAEVNYTAGDTRNQAQSWSDRTVLDDAVWSHNGAPLEFMIQMANENLFIPWFCIPLGADNNYVTQYATVIRDNLDPRLWARIELSNEIWNAGTFLQWQYARDQAFALWGNYDHINDWIGKRNVEMIRIFQTVFGGNYSSRIKWHIATHTGYRTWEDTLMATPHWAANGPNFDATPASLADEYGITTYFMAHVGSTQNETWLNGVVADSLAVDSTYDQANQVVAHEGYDGRYRGGLFDPVGNPTAGPDHAIERMTGSNIDTGSTTYHAGRAAFYGLDLVAYEGNQHLYNLPGTNPAQTVVDWYHQFPYSQEYVDTLLEYLLAQWKTQVEDVFGSHCGWMHYSSVFKPTSQFGMWGILRHIDDTNPHWERLQTYGGARP